MSDATRADDLRQFPDLIEFQAYIIRDEALRPPRYFASCSWPGAQWVKGYPTMDEATAGLIEKVSEWPGAPWKRTNILG